MPSLLTSPGNLSFITLKAYMDFYKLLNSLITFLIFALSIKLFPPVIPATNNPIIIRTMDNSISEKALL